MLFIPEFFLGEASFCLGSCVAHGAIFDYFCIVSKRYYLEY